MKIIANFFFIIFSLLLYIDFVKLSYINNEITTSLEEFGSGEEFNYNEEKDESDDSIKTFGLSNDPDDVMFRLYYSSKFPKRYDELIYNNDKSIANARFVIGEPLTFVVHGFLSSADAQNSTVPLIKSALLKVAKPNVIAVDWSRLAFSKSPVAFLSYAEVTQNVPIVGKRVGEMIEFLIKSGIANGPEMFHLIGHSLGAHVMGVAGYTVQQNLGSSIDHITGLDPAGPLYNFMNKKDKLDPADAVFIDILHTDIGMFGSSELLGTVDFFANGGKGLAQPGCINFTNANPGAFLRGVSGVCSHARAYQLYARSIKKVQPELYGCRCTIKRPLILPTTCSLQEMIICQDKVLFGYYVPKTAVGNYFLDTRGAKDVDKFDESPLELE